MYISIYHSAIAHPWISVVVLLVLGVVIGWYLFGRFPTHRIRHIVRTVFEPSTIEELSLGSLFSRVRVQGKVSPERLALAFGSPVKSAARRPEQIPPFYRRIHSHGPLAASLKVDEEAGVVWYRHPGDTNPDEPTEFGIPLSLPVRQLLKTGRIERSDLRMIPLTVEHDGTWLTALIDEVSNLSLADPPTTWKLRKVRTRRPHFSDYYPKGAPIGWVLVRDARKKKTYHRYDAPANVLFAQHSVAPGEPVDSGDIVALLAEVQGVVDVTSGHVGTFFRNKPNEPALVTVGQTVVVGQSIGLIHHLNNWTEIASPTDGLVLRIDVPNDTPVQYGQRLFQIKAPSPSR